MPVDGSANSSGEIRRLLIRQQAFDASESQARRCFIGGSAFSWVRFVMGTQRAVKTKRTQSKSAPTRSAAFLRLFLQPYARLTAVLVEELNAGGACAGRMATAGFA